LETGGGRAGDGAPFCRDANDEPALLGQLASSRSSRSGWLAGWAVARGAILLACQLPRAAATNSSVGERRRSTSLHVDRDRRTRRRRIIGVLVDDRTNSERPPLQLPFPQAER